MLRSSLKTIGLIFLIFMVSILFISPQALGKKSKKVAMTPEEMTALTSSVNRLVKKVYSSSLFSPSDTDALFEAKLKVDAEIGAPSPDPAFGDLVYKIAFILKEREYKDDAIDYYRTLVDKFPDSPYITKATVALQQLGVKLDAGASDSSGE